MKREVSLNEISDGKLYGLNDMVRADCHDCQGCFACCQGMGSSIVLDPLDIFRLSAGLGTSFEALMAGGKLELNVEEGVILPNLAMAGPKECCSFLNEEGRCSIHPHRPGICRLFPLGRYYENQSFQYFLQIHECKKENKTKVKVRKWIDTPDIRNNERFISQWHYFLSNVKEQVAAQWDEDRVKAVNMYILKSFYIKPYDTSQDFYPQFEERLAEAVGYVGGEEIL